MSKKDKFDNYEKELIDSLEAGEWQSIDKVDEKKKELEQIAKNTIRKSKRINIRITEQDFYLAHVKALEEGLPYQTLLASIIHKYLHGRLKDSSN